jgi:Tfp pilus assembly protein PilV
MRKCTKSERGSLLIEMMIAMLVLSVGLLGAIAMVSASIQSNFRSKQDSTSAALAQMFIGQLSATSASTTSVSVTDCAGNTGTVNTTGATTGSGATLTSSGAVDFTQAFSAVTSGYAIKYTVCSVATGAQSVYDVRWNITQLPSGKENYVVVGVQLVGSNSNNASFAVPVNVRTVVGNQGS